MPLAPKRAPNRHDAGAITPINEDRIGVMLIFKLREHVGYLHVVVVLRKGA